MGNKIERVMLIQPPDPEGKKILRDHAGRFGIVEEKSSLIRYDILPPLFLAYSAALLEENNFNVKIIDSPTLNLKKEDVLDYIFDQNPDIIFVNSNTASILSDIDFAEWVKLNSEKEIVLLAQTFTPKNILKESSIDIFIQGEIEYTILELCQEYPNLKQIKGVFYKKGKELIENSQRPFTKDLNKLPLPAYHLLPMGKYSYQMYSGKKFITVLTSRGCPFGCKYCPYPIGYGDFWRGRSTENVIKELKLLTEKYDIKNILFRDQVFNMNPKRVEKICDAIIKEGIKINWRAEGRADIFTKKLLDKMKSAGCIGIHVGIESGDVGLLKKMAKGGFKEDDIKKYEEVFSYTKEIGIETVAFFMIGFPDETKQSILKTIELVRKLKPNRAWFSSVIPYPGTELHEIAKENGWLISENIEDYTGRKSVMRTDHLSEKEIKEIVDKANFMFSKDNNQFLKSVFSLKGIKTAILNPKRAFNFTFGRIFNRNKFKKGG